MLSRVTPKRQRRNVSRAHRALTHAVTDSNENPRRSSLRPTLVGGQVGVRNTDRHERTASNASMDGLVNFYSNYELNVVVCACDFREDVVDGPRYNACRACARRRRPSHRRRSYKRNTFDKAFAQRLFVVVLYLGLRGEGGGAVQSPDKTARNSSAFTFEEEQPFTTMTLRLERRQT